MDGSNEARERDIDSSTEEIIVRADEVDETGADISTISPTDAGDFEARVEARRQQDIQAIGSPKLLANAVSSVPKPLARPTISREGSAPPPPRQPPPPAPLSQEDAPLMADSLSLAELKNMVKDFPKSESAAYAYEYEDTRTMPEELEEWFQYTTEDTEFLIRAKKTFEKEISQFDWGIRPGSTSGVHGRYRWLRLTSELQEKFIFCQLQGLATMSATNVTEKLESVAHIAMGVWQETTWLEDHPLPDEKANYEPPNEKYRKTVGQLDYIRKAAEFLSRAGLVQILYDVLRSVCDDDKAYGMTNLLSGSSTVDGAQATQLNRECQLTAILSCMYFMVEVGRQQVARGEKDKIRQSFVTLQPSILHYLTNSVAKLRWDDAYNLPITKVLLLLWKIILLVFGGTKELKESKSGLCKYPDSNRIYSEALLTASPLDYHIFRQEITSKYPAYNPPPPLIPLELNNSSILPPLATHPSRSASQDSLASVAGTYTSGIGKSIFHQPVHISTPAPSPPPSPAGPGGKGGKKQNYQTNQNFPFLYPPPDDTSNVVGGKGTARLQDRLVGKRWEGYDIPASILEAGQLFASRMRMSRSLRQLWEVREEFMKFERGWECDEKKEKGLDADLEELDLEIEVEGAEKDPDDVLDMQGLETDQQLSRETDNETTHGRLDAVESYYRSSLPHLQSIVIVLLKIVLSNVTALGNQANVQNGVVSTFPLPEATNGELRLPKLNLNLAKQINGTTNGERAEDEMIDPAIVELNATRLREITSKAVAGILLMLLKWFKLSHVLKFEYLTQLLLDSNYLPLALKLFANQDVDTAVYHKNDRDDLSFFHICRLNSGHPPSPPVPRNPSASSSSSSSSSTSSSSSAVPPAIPKTRPPFAISPPPSPGASPSPPPPNPEVDELGQPTTTLPSAPLTTYAPRFFHTTITHLRLLQKISKRKAHRALLLVQYKSSTILRRLLKIPQHALRLYTLKLFKSQVPYCGRKWRQTNMRVITAIYLHCRPELRDEWISGGGVEEAVEEAVPLEQAGRGLVHWWHLRRYRGVMGEEREALGDFFERELEKMGWGLVAEGEGDEWEGGMVGEGW